MSDPFITAIVLAAGKSSRMGSLKQLMQVGDRTLLQTTLDTVAGSNVNEIVLVLGHQAETISNFVKLPSNAKLILNQEYEKGMSSSIRAGISHVSTDTSAALIVLSDQPWISSTVIDALIQEYQQTRAPIVIPVYKGFRGNPVLIDRSLFPEMMQISGDIGCRSLFGLHADQIRKTTVNDVGILIDIDSPEDLASLQGKQNANETSILELEVEDRQLADTKKVIIVGSDEIAFALARIAKILKFFVIVVDPLLTQQELPEADRIIRELDLSRLHANPESSIVVASRGKYDEEALEQAIATPASYIALVGSKKRGAEIIARLANSEAAQRIRCPAGLSIGASTPEEIALSVMAEIVQSLQKNAK